MDVAEALFWSSMKLECRGRTSLYVPLPDPGAGDRAGLVAIKPLLHVPDHPCITTYLGVQTTGTLPIEKQ